MTSRENVFLSVIVPVYGIPYDLLRCCLGTLSGQPCEAAEFIVVDDGSPDECGVICDDFASLDLRFRVFHVENGGVSVARNIALDHATGSHVVFVDADDGVYPGFFPGLIDRLSEDHSDVVFFGYTDSSKDGADAPAGGKVMSPHAPLPSSFEIARSVVDHTDPLLGLPEVMFGSPWGKAFRRDFLEEHGCRFPVGIKKSQDRIFVVDSLSHRPSMSVYEACGYVYVDRGSSICHGYNPRILDILGNTVECFSDVIERDFSGEELEEMRGAENYLKVNYFFSSLPISYFHIENPRFGHEKEGFKRLCAEKSGLFKACKASKMPIKPKRVLLPLLKLGIYGAVYDLLSWYYGRGARQ